MSPAFVACPGLVPTRRRCRSLSLLTRNYLRNSPRCGLERNQKSSSVSEKAVSSREGVTEMLISSGSLAVEDRQMLEMLTPSRAALFAKVLNNRTRHITFVLDGVFGAHNLAAIARSCDAWGVQDLHLIMQPSEYLPARHQGTGETVKPPTSILEQFKTDHSVQNVSKNCHKWLSIREYCTAEPCLHDLRRAGYKIMVSSLTGDAKSIHEVDLSGKCAFVFGNERHGVTKKMQAEADGFFTVPMMGFVESMNVSVAVGSTACLAITRSREILDAADFLLSLSERKVLAHEWLSDRFSSKSAPRKLHSRRDVTKLGSRCEDRIIKDGLFAKMDNGASSSDEYWKQAFRLTGNGGARLAMIVQRHKIGALGESTFEKTRLAIKNFLGSSHALSCEAAITSSESSGISRQLLKPYFELVCEKVSDLYAPYFDQFAVPLLPMYAEESASMFAKLEQIAPRISAEVCTKFSSDIFGLSSEDVTKLINSISMNDIAFCLASTIRCDEERTKELISVFSDRYSGETEVLMLMKQRYPRRVLYEIPPHVCKRINLEGESIFDARRCRALNGILRLWNVGFLASELYQALWDRQLKGKNVGRIHTLRFGMLESLICESYAEMQLLNSSRAAALSRVVIEWHQAFLGLQTNFGQINAETETCS